MTLDLIGGSSYLWHWKHVVFHHTYVNVTGHDDDIDLGVLGPPSPSKKSFNKTSWKSWDTAALATERLRFCPLSPTVHTRG